MQRTLSRDIRWVGDSLGEVLRAHGSRQLFETVEAMRANAKLAREARDTPRAKKARARIVQIAAELPPDVALDVVRAFTLYFQLVNLAENVHRCQRLRMRERESGAAGVEESLPSVVAQLASSGASRAAVQNCLSELSVQFVFTAHPTEARRRTTERLLAMARISLEERDRVEMTPTDLRIAERRLRAAIEGLWEHSAERQAKPDVMDEVRTGLWYAEHVLFDNVPRLLRRLHRAMAVGFGPCEPLDLPSIVSFGSWMGSDRDGNPFVNESTTAHALQLAQDTIFVRYQRDLVDLLDQLAGSTGRLVLDEAISQVLASAHNIDATWAESVKRRNPEEPLRQAASVMIERIRRTQHGEQHGYARPEDFVRDLTALRSTLLRSGAQALANHDLLSLIQRVRCFGFHLFSLDIREDSRVHRVVIGELLRDPGYAERPSEERERALTGLSLPSDQSKLSEAAQRLIALYKSIAPLQEKYGQRALSTYIISMCESRADVMEVMAMADLFGVADALDIVPLLETKKALSIGGELLQSLLATPSYRAHLNRRGNIQELLVGYSDSMKENGIMDSRRSIIDAQREAKRVCQKEDVTLRVFHGRGGSVSRGGGPTFQAMLAIPSDAFSSVLKITEQGETRSAHFAHPDLCVRHIEQTVGGALLSHFGHATAVSLDWVASNKAPTKDAALTHPNANERTSSALLKRLADDSRKHYRKLVQKPELVQFFVEGTPLDVVTALHLGSRPARRGKSLEGIQDLRAIPWVFAWSQARAVITGWYGVGTALTRAAEAKHGMRDLRATYRTDPFFRDLLDNVQMTLAKADIHIAELYSTLCLDPAVRQTIFGAIRREFERSVSMVLRITEQTSLLDHHKTIQRSIKLRNPYVDPLSYLQLEALRKGRSLKGKLGESYMTVARVAVVGIAAGLRNTG